MKKSNWLGVALSVLAMVVFLVWSSADAQKPGGAAAPVIVQNGPLAPVPISAPAPIPVTGSLAVSNTVPVSGTVNVGGTAHVIVDNGDSNPVAVRNVGEGQITPFSFFRRTSGPSWPSDAYYDVPTDKALIIEYVNASCWRYEPELHIRMYLGATFIGDFGFGATAKMTPDDVEAQYMRYMISEPVKIYCPPGHRVSFLLTNATLVNHEFSQVAIQGHLIDVSAVQ